MRTEEVKGALPMLSLIVAATLAGSSFPLPTIDGKPLAVTEGQKVFRLPMRYEKVKAFYEERFAADAKHPLKPSGDSFTLTSKDLGDRWKKAVVKKGELETVVELTPVLSMTEESVDGRGKPLVEFVIGRNKNVEAAIDSIDHLER